MTGRWVGFLRCIRLRSCPHEHVRCIHGDEIFERMPAWRKTLYRAACLDCGRALDRPLPEPCSVTGRPHGHVR